MKNVLLAFLALSGMMRAADFQSRWDTRNDAVWIGPEYWANPMEDWKLENGRIECVRGGGNRNVHLLTHQLGTRGGEFTMSVLVGRADEGKGAGSAGFHAHMFPAYMFPAYMFPVILLLTAGGRGGFLVACRKRVIWPRGNRWI